MTGYDEPNQNTNGMNVMNPQTVNRKNGLPRGTSRIS